MICLGCIRNDLETRLKWFRRRLDLPGKHLAEVVSEELGMVWIRMEWPGDKTIPVSTVMPEALLTITGTVKHVHHDLSYQEELFPHCREEQHHVKMWDSEPWSCCAQVKVRSQESREGESLGTRLGNHEVEEEKAPMEVRNDGEKERDTTGTQYSISIH